MIKYTVYHPLKRKWLTLNSRWSASPVYMSDDHLRTILTFFFRRKGSMFDDIKRCKIEKHGASLVKVDSYKGNYVELFEQEMLINELSR